MTRNTETRLQASLIVQTRSGGREVSRRRRYEYLRNDAPQREAVRCSEEDRPTKEKRLFGANVGGPDLDSRVSPRERLRKKGTSTSIGRGFQDHGGANSNTLSDRFRWRARAGKLQRRWQPTLLPPQTRLSMEALAGTAIPNNQIDPQFEDPIAKAFPCGAAETLPITRKSTNYFIPRAGAGIVNQQRRNVYFFRIDTKRWPKGSFFTTPSGGNSAV